MRRALIIALLSLLPLVGLGVFAATSADASSLFTWHRVSHNARQVGFRPVPRRLGREYRGCLWLQGATSVILCPDGRVETS